MLKPIPTRGIVAVAMLALAPLAAVAASAPAGWPTPPAAESSGAYDPAPSVAPEGAPSRASVIYNGPIVNLGSPASTVPATAYPAPAADLDPTLRSRRAKPDPANDPHQRGLRLGGPRFGVSYADGGGYDKLVKAVHDEKPDATVDRFMTQFGWQMEYRMFRTDEGVTAVSELIPLVGGLDQGLALPSATWLVGLRNADGWELGVGPDFGLGGVSLMMGAGATFDLGGINVPVNLAVGRGANETTSTCLSIGFNL